jgi:hypothetical protein
MGNNASDITHNSIGLDAVTERKRPCLGDGSLLPGSACSINESTGKVQASDAGSEDSFTGLLEKRYDKTIDQAPPDAETAELIIPRQGHKYCVRIDSANTSSLNEGDPLELSETSNGEFMEAADLGDNVMCRLAQDYNGTDDFAKVYWGGA